MTRGELLRSIHEEGCTFTKISHDIIKYETIIEELSSDAIEIIATLDNNTVTSISGYLNDKLIMEGEI